ncbi:hypothetical protein RD792_017814 [Penstemon davidsonii]|uniref:Signal peptidase complex subunit 2 n=1 Tax=Penstemon davidsonii TaxID=160366 RepID=A0ABR0DWP2_9LAMI|nr:hypothetical protein RD792_017814 [Penstemon davidsonii]
MEEKKNEKKTNLFDHNSIKHVLDESVTEIVKNKGFPEDGSFNSTGLAITSKLPRFSDMYTLTITSADPQSISAKPPVEFTKSVTKWFTKDGVMVEGLFWKDVEGLINDYVKENKKSK